MLDSSAFMSRPSSRGQSGFVGDELYFTGYDLGRARSSGNSPYDETGYGEEDGYSDEEEQYEYERQRYAAYLASMRDREEAVVQSAQEKIRKAKARGKTNVNLNQEEVDALEKRRMQQQQQQELTAPRTPAKGKTSRSNSAVSLTADKNKKKSGGFFGGAARSSSKTPNGKSPKTPRKSSRDKTSASPAPGFMVQGPHGQPVYAPFGYFPPPPDNFRPPSGSSRSGSRSASASSKRQITPPYDVPYPPYPAYPPRYYPMPEDLRPPSSSSRRSPDDLYIPRNRANTSAHYPDDLHLPPMPAAQGRRNVTGPPDVSYTKLRRMAPSSPLAEQPSLPPRSDSLPDRRSGQPVRVERRASSSSDSESSSEDDDQGVSVEIVPESKDDGYRIDRVPVSGAEGERRRRSKR